MTAPLSPDRTDEIAQQAMISLRQHGLAPTPRNFAVWFTYHADTNPKLSLMIDLLQSEREQISERICDELHSHYVLTEHPQKVLAEIGKRLDILVNQIEAVLTDARDTTTKIGCHLQNVCEEAVGIHGAPPMLKPLIERALNEARETLGVVRRLETRVGESSVEIASLRSNLDEVRREAMTDALTGIANRKLFDRRLIDAAKQAGDEGQPLSLIMVDIDHFKVFNDTWGHLLGDMVLKFVAKILSDHVKGRDLPARFGGEEFAIILPRTTLDGAVTVARQIARTLATKRPSKTDDNTDLGPITVSIGVAGYRLNEPPSQMITRADAALYLAKRRGRNCIVDETMLDAETATR